MVYNCSTLYRQAHNEINQIINQCRHNQHLLVPVSFIRFAHSVLIMYAMFGMFISYPSIAVLIKLFPASFAYSTMRAIIH